MRLIIFYIFALLCISPAALADLVGQAETGIRHDNNLNNAQAGRDIAAGSIVDATLSATEFFAFEQGYSLSLSGALNSEAVDHYSGLNHQSLGAAMAFRKKWGLGPYAPWTALSLSTSRLDYNDNNRDGWLHQAALRAGQRFFERWDLVAEYQLGRRTAHSQLSMLPGMSGDVYSQSSNTLLINAEYIWSDDLYLSFGTLLRQGDVVSSTRRGLNIFTASKALAPDPVFGPDFYAYRMTGVTHGVNMDIHLSVTRHSLLQASLLRQLTHATGDNNYAKSSCMLSWNYNF